MKFIFWFAAWLLFQTWLRDLWTGYSFSCWTLQQSWSLQWFPHFCKWEETLTTTKWYDTPTSEVKTNFLRAEVFSCKRDRNPRGSSPHTILKSQRQFSIHCFLIRKLKESGYTMNQRLYGNGGRERLLIELIVYPVAWNLTLTQNKIISAEDSCSMLQNLLWSALFIANGP